MGNFISFISLIPTILTYSCDVLENNDKSIQLILSKENNINLTYNERLTCHNRVNYMYETSLNIQSAHYMMDTTLVNLLNNFAYLCIEKIMLLNYIKKNMLMSSNDNDYITIINQYILQIMFSLEIMPYDTKFRKNNTSFICIHLVRVIEMKKGDDYHIVESYYKTMLNDYNINLYEL